MIKAKAMDADSYRDFEIKENICLGKVGLKHKGKQGKYKIDKKFHLDFGSIGVDIQSIYAKDNYIPTRTKNRREEDKLAREPVCNPRLSRHHKAKEKKIKFPKSIEKNENFSKGKIVQNSQKKKFYSLSRQLLAGRISKKLVEFSRGDKKHQSESFSRSFRRKRSEGGGRRENNSFVLERRHSRERRNASMDGSKIMR